MSNFYVRGVLANLMTLSILLVCMFIPAGTLDYWQAWVFAAVFGFSSQAMGIFFLVHDRKLVERRMNIGPWRNCDRLSISISIEAHWPSGPFRSAFGCSQFGDGFHSRARRCASASWSGVI